MALQWQVTIKQTLLSDITRLPAKEVHQVMTKIDLLSQDPAPDGKVKKQLKHMGNRLCRIRSGDYRIFYTITKQVINILTIRRRFDPTYWSTTRKI